MGLKRTSCGKQSALSPINRVVIVADFGPDVQHYQSEFLHLTFPPPRNCPHCAATKPLVGHGSYQRTACDERQLFVIRVRRFLCTLCRHTVSLLPSFCVPCRHYLASTIETVLSLRFEAKASWQAICLRFSPTGAPGLSSCREWATALSKASAAYVNHLLHQLAAWQLAPGKLEMAIEDISACPQGPQQLLAAVPHLVAWLHDNGVMVSEGGKRWLPTLWHWGHGAKLGRLV